MGNTDSTDLKETNRFQVYSQGKDSTLLQQKMTGEELCLKELVFHNSKQFKEYEEYVSTKVDKNHRHLTQFKELRVKSNFQLCSNLYRMQILFEHPFKTLNDEVNERRLTCNYFKQNQILSILYSCLLGLQHLNSCGIDHHCIRSNRIFISKQGFIKLSQPKLFQQICNLDLARIDGTNPTLILSPQQISFTLDPKPTDLSKSDIFVLGMVILEVISLKQVKHFYNPHCTEIMRNRLDEVLNQISIRYSYKLRDLIESMLVTDPAHRVELNQLVGLIHDKVPLGNHVEVLQNRNPSQTNSHKTFKLNKPGILLLNQNSTNTPSPVAKHSKQNISNKTDPAQFPEPKRATLWINKSTSNSPQTRRKVIKILPNKLQTPPVYPLNSSHSNHSKKINPSSLPGLPNFCVMKHQLQQVSVASKERLQFLKNYNYVNPSRSTTQLKQSLVSNHTISEVTQPDCSQLQQIRMVYEKYAEGSYYQGQKMGNVRHGSGKFFYKDGGHYDGQWRFDKMNGEGRLYYQNGKIAYDGEWKDDQFHGFGKVYNDQPNSNLIITFKSLDFSELQDFWIYYEGQFVKDTKHGKGKVMLTNGQHFQGTFVDDAVHGQGQFHTTTGAIINGIWNQNKLTSSQ